METRDDVPAKTMTTCLNGRRLVWSCSMGFSWVATFSWNAEGVFACVRGEDEVGPEASPVGDWGGEGRSVGLGLAGDETRVEEGDML